MNNLVAGTFQWPSGKPQKVKRYARRQISKLQAHKRRPKRRYGK